MDLRVAFFVFVVNITVTGAKGVPVRVFVTSCTEWEIVFLINPRERTFSCFYNVIVQATKTFNGS